MIDLIGMIDFVRPSVRHTLVLCQNDSSYSEATIMGSSLKDSLMTVVSSCLTLPRKSKRGSRM